MARTTFNVWVYQREADKTMDKRKTKSGIPRIIVILVLYILSASLRIILVEVY